jgi:hypothetical protein
VVRLITPPMLKFFALFSMQTSKFIKFFFNVPKKLLLPPVLIYAGSNAHRLPSGKQAANNDCKGETRKKGIQPSFGLVSPAHCQKGHNRSAYNLHG